MFDLGNRKMPLNQNYAAILGASVFGIFCAATLYVVEHWRQDRRRHVLETDVARLNQDMFQLKRELEQLMKKQHEKSKEHKKRSGGRKGRTDTVTSSSTTDEYTSALELDSSDLEFYDLTDEDDEPSISILENVDLDLTDLDDKLENGTRDEVEESLIKLHEMTMARPDRPHLYWRVGKAQYRLGEKAPDKETCLKHYERGIEACKAALDLQPELADVHKWLAILVGRRSDYQPMKEKILDGRLFKEHVDRAIELNPSDPPLHHMLGRFDFELAGLKWYEKKIASALFAEVPNATYAEALEHFLEAERLTKKNWQENKLMIGKCKIALGETEDGVEWLEKAAAVAGENAVLDAKVEKEVKELLAKYRR